MDHQLSGIGLLALNSKRESQVSLLADDSPESLRSYTDDRHWSWGALRDTFKLHDLQGLFKRYARRVQNAYFNVYLLLQMFISICTIVGLVAFNCNDPDKFKVAIPEVSVHSIILCTCGTLFATTLSESLFKKRPWTQVLHSCIVVFMILGCDIALTLYFYIYYGRVRVASAFQTLIIIYFFLPLPRKYQPIFLGIVVSVSHLIMSGVLRNQYPNLTSRLAADFVYYLCGNLVGMYAQMINEVTIRRAFLDRRGYIQSTIKKSFEKGQEEHLLLSILPRHIASKVKDELVCALEELEETERLENYLKKKPHHRFRPHFAKNRKSRVHRYGVINKKPFSDLFVDHHNNVTILFADIVNFTPLTVKLKANELVATLNELFGRFDEAAQSRNCLRIKLIGDCYYCVSGLPTPTPDHARNCVEFGFDMIEIIRDIRAKLKVDIAMRIGIHSGSIISGIIGIYKWHFDIWSRDTLIANHMEQTGKPGRIHVTRQTKDILENNNDGGGGTTLSGKVFHFTPEYGQLRDKYLAENKIETFLIVSPNKAFVKKRRRNSNSITSTGSQEIDQEVDEILDLPALPRNGVASVGKQYSRRPSTTTWMGRRQSASAISSRKSADAAVIRRKSFLRRATDVTGENLALLRQMMSKVNEEMEKAIDEMPLRKSDQWFGNPNFGEPINPLLISFHSWRSERRYQTQPDPLFKFYIVSAFFVLICIGIIQGLMMPSAHIVLWISFSIATVFLLALIPHAWASYIWNRLHDPHREMESVPEPKSKIMLFFYRTSNSITSSLSLRILFYVCVAVILSTFAIIDVVDCRNEDGDNVSDDCKNPWYFTYSCTLAILGIYGFFRIHFLLKLLLVTASLFAYSFTIYNFRVEVFANDLGASPALNPETAHLIYLIKIVLLLHIMDRQLEYINRLDFLWKRRLTDEHHEAARTHETNSILIHNILPPLIARIYLDPHRTEIHSRNYTDVSVMFASIPNFTEFFTQNDFHEHGIRCLQLLNEIIVEFDQVLVNFLEVEKIKVIGSTYMAAAGLQVRETTRQSISKRRSTVEEDYQELLRERARGNSYIVNPKPDYDKRRSSLVSLVLYSTTLMKALKGINKDSFQNFQLRIGMDSGPVVAGVIGTSKPLYDIWGDTVNMASRMDTTGVPDKIQLGENSADLLKEAGIKCTFRDRIKVKGKHQLIPTYFVDLNSDYDIQCEATTDCFEKDIEIENTYL